MKKAVCIIIGAALLLALLASCGARPEAEEPGPAQEAGPASEEITEGPVSEVWYEVRSFEWGPGVDKLILTLTEEADDIDDDGIMSVTTAQWARVVTKAYLSDADGEPVEGPSDHAALELFTTIDVPGSPLAYDPETQTNHWAETFMVDVRLRLFIGGEKVLVRYRGNCAENRLCPEMALFPVTGVCSGEHQNVLSGSSEILTLSYAATQPDYLEGGEKNPLIIWLHGRGEGGTDIANAILGNEVSSLAQDPIQSYFTAGEQTGAYVLAVQTPTYWMDAGDEMENEGDMNSRYETLLMDTINTYLDENPDVDRDRIYLMGGSNGGFMTVEMLVLHPGFFAAAVPCSPAFAYYVYAREDDGSYRTFGPTKVRTNEKFLTEEKIGALLQTPMWIICSATDTLVPTSEYAAPLYYELLKAGADDCWCSLYIGVEGTEDAQTQYLGHWTWVYLFNDQVSWVQDTRRVLESDEDTYLYGMTPDRNGGRERVPDGNGYYESVFAWLNDKSLS